MAANSKTRRLFLALWPEDALREALIHATRNALRDSGGRPVPAAQWHSTLVFLGSVEEARVALVKEAAASVHFTPFQLRFDGIEHWAKAQVLCVVARAPPDAAVALALALRRALVERKFSPDLKPWRAHMTLARKVSQTHEMELMHPVAWQVRDFALVESETLPQGPRYTLLERWR